MEPHQHCHIWRGGPTSGQHHPVTVNIPILNQSVTTAGTHVFFFILLSLTLLVCVSSSGRKGFVWTMRSPRRSISILLLLAVFISALYPTRNRLPIVLYLTLSTLWGYCLYFSGHILPLLICIDGCLKGAPRMILWRSGFKPSYPEATYAIFCRWPLAFASVLVKLYSDDYWSVNTKVQRAVRREKISNAMLWSLSIHLMALRWRWTLPSGQRDHIRSWSRRQEQTDGGLLSRKIVLSYLRQRYSRSI